MARYKYMGDVNLEHGGYFYRAPDWKHGYAEAVRVMPCSDAGAQDNAWWVECLTVIVPKTVEELREVMACVGTSVTDAGELSDEQGSPIWPNGSEHRARVIDACIAYGEYDIDQSTAVQIGREADDCSEPVVPDTTLRAGSSLARFVRREFLKG